MWSHSLTLRQTGRRLIYLYLSIYLSLARSHLCVALFIRCRPYKWAVLSQARLSSLSRLASVCPSLSVVGSSAKEKELPL
mmetsp:Transcript_2061/g.4632  ORF Transcript_2061/g.4632 Transcript_2061/m.4632 type:complete len:80 (+) Transcript_2061:529-768(+)